jgi:O-glycosyl hydrolase
MRTFEISQVEVNEARIIDVTDFPTLPNNSRKIVIVPKDAPTIEGFEFGCYGKSIFVSKDALAKHLADPRSKKSGERYG